MAEKKLTNRTIFSYGFMAMPLYFIVLPLYIYLPKIYHQQYGMDIFKIALIIFATRIIDLICMPAIGLWLDKLNLNRVYRKKIVYISLPLIALSFNFLIFPLLPTAINLFVFSLTTHLLLTIIIISYYAISVELTSNYKKQNKVSACREFFKAVGVVIAVLFPTGIMTEKYGFEASYNSLIIVLVVALFVAGILMNFVKAKSTVTFHFQVRPKVITDIINSKPLGRFLLIFFINSLAIALPNTVGLYFIQYVIKPSGSAGLFLVVYYIAAIISIPIWMMYSSAHSKKTTWLTSMCIAALFYLSVYFLGEGDVLEFYIISALTGVTLGADLLFAGSIYSDNIKDAHKGASHYSLWLMASKGAFAAGSLLSLALLKYYGFEIDSFISDNLKENGIFALSIIYCLVPAALKIISALLLANAKVDTRL